MKIKVKSEKNNVLKEFIYEHRTKIIIGMVLAGTAIAYVKFGGKPKIKETLDIVETASEPGYDIWAMCNGLDEKVIEFIPKLEEFAGENGISIMCDVI